MTNDIFNILNALETSEQKAALSTIIQVTGSSYRKKGSMMLFQEDDTQIGLLSGGCLEDDLALRAEEAIQEQKSRSIVYDMTSEDDLGWGQGSGCNGKIEVLLEPISHQMKCSFKRANYQLKKGIPLVQIKRLSKSGAVLNYIFITENEESFGDWSGDIPTHFLSFLSVDKKDVTLLESESERYFIQVFHPKPRLIIFGAGPDVRPLVDVAAITGFHIVLNDWRPAFTEKAYFPLAAEIITKFPSSFVKEFSFSSTDFVLIMTHNFQKDQEILKHLLERNLQYLGILGPRKRTHRLLEGKDIPDFLHSPVGLSIGAEGPQEIAISILAELIGTVRKRD